jgi:sugar lactone lactonase YvrE
MSPRSIKPTLLRKDECLLAEGPFWYEEQFWWVDIERGLLLSVDVQGNLLQRVEFGKRIGAAVPAGNGIFMVALEMEIARLHLGSKKWEKIAQPEDVPPQSRFNDGKCDPRGRLIVGTMSTNGSPKGSSLYSLRRDDSLHRLRGGISISNGLAWSADGGTMYFIDTPESCVFAYDYDLDTGSISGERVILRFAEKEGFPDGMSIDREGRLWIGFWDGWAVRCYHPKTGECEAVIEIPCSRATSCCFGGPDLDRLFITTASVGLSESEKMKQPLAGSLFVCDPGTTGFPTFTFTYDDHKKS